jgi:predicted ATPase with chaperone activity
MQNKRFSKIESTDIICNAARCLGDIRQFCRLREEGQSLMQAVIKLLNLSARAYYRTVNLARMIANLGGI